MIKNEPTTSRSDTEVNAIDEPIKKTLQNIFSVDVDALADSQQASDPDFQEFFNEVNPETGLRYDIPMLVSTDPEYAKKYVANMRIKRTDPVLFEKILNWD